MDTLPVRLDLFLNLLNHCLLVSLCRIKKEKINHSACGKSASAIFKNFF